MNLKNGEYDAHFPLDAQREYAEFLDSSRYSEGQGDGRNGRKKRKNLSYLIGKGEGRIIVLKRKINSVKDTLVRLGI